MWKADFAPTKTITIDSTLDAQKWMNKDVPAEF
jgi:hypothetical protein